MGSRGGEPRRVGASVDEADAAKADALDERPRPETAPSTRGSRGSRGRRLFLRGEIVPEAGRDTRRSRRTRGPREANRRRGGSEFVGGDRRESLEGSAEGLGSGGQEHDDDVLPVVAGQNEVTDRERRGRGVF